MKGILNQKMLLMRLRYLRYINGESRVCEIFFDSTHIKGRPTGQNIGKSILEIFEYNGTNVAKCSTQVYYGDKIVTSEISGAACLIKKTRGS